MKKIAMLFIFLSWIVPFIIALKSILSGSIPFWYDPARDLLSAWDNLNKPTLIGPPTGIPGVFYGPYWIWLLSFSLIISKDPRLAIFLVGIIPYFIIAPLVFSTLRKSIGNLNALILWLLFIFSSINYATFLWNPHPSPVLFLIIFYLLLVKEKNDFKTAFFYGLLIGGILNFHLSFGIGVFLGMVLIYLTDFFLTKKKTIIYSLLPLILGIISVFIPVLLFELRHGGNQIKAVLGTLNKAFLQHHASVGVTGLTKAEIGSSFLKRFSNVLNLPFWLILVIIVTVLVGIVYLVITKKFKADIITKNLILVTVLFSTSILFIYLTSANPVWDYHFIGVEIIVLSLVLLILKVFNWSRWLFCLLVIIILFGYIVSLIQSFINPFNPLTQSTLYNKEYIINTICLDAKSSKYQIFAYSSAIYTFDFDYIVRWYKITGKCQKQIRETKDAEMIYLIIPSVDKNIFDDFIHYKTPDNKYYTSRTISIPDGTTIVKRIVKK